MQEQLTTTKAIQGQVKKGLRSTTAESIYILGVRTRGLPAYMDLFCSYHYRCNAYWTVLIMNLTSLICHFH